MKPGEPGAPETSGWVSLLTEIAKPLAHAAAADIRVAAALLAALMFAVATIVLGVALSAQHPTGAVILEVMLLAFSIYTFRSLLAAPRTVLPVTAPPPTRRPSPVASSKPRWILVSAATLTLGAVVLAIYSFLTPLVTGKPPLDLAPLKQTSETPLAATPEVPRVDALFEVPASEPGVEISSAAFSTDGTRFLTASQSQLLRVWDTATGARLGDFGAPRENQFIWHAAFGLNNAYIVIAQNSGVGSIIDAASGRHVASLSDPSVQGSMSSAEFSPDGGYIVTTHVGGAAELWQRTQGVDYRVVPSHPFRAYGEATDAQFSPDGQWLVTAHWNGQAVVWRTQPWDTTPRVLVREPGSAVTSAVFSRDSRHVLTSHEDGTAWLWLVDTASVVHELCPGRGAGALVAISMSYAGTYAVTGSKDGKARVCDVSTGTYLLELPFTQQAGWVFSTAFSPSSDLIITAKGVTAQLWALTPP